LWASAIRSCRHRASRVGLARDPHAEVENTLALVLAPFPGDLYGRYIQDY